MTKKKTPTPVKKAATKKKAVGGKAEAKWVCDLQFLNTEQPPYMQDYIKKYGGTMADDLSLGVIAPPTGENRISELEAENYALKTLLSKHQSEPMENKQSLPERATMLSQFAEAFDGQLSRLYNSLNTLDAISNRLVANKEDGIKGNAPEAQDLSSRLSNLIGYFSHQNDRLDMLNAKLSDLI